MLRPSVRLTSRSRILLALGSVAAYLCALGTCAASAASVQLPLSLWFVMLIVSASVALMVLLKKRARYAVLVAHIKIIAASKPLDRIAPTHSWDIPVDPEEADYPYDYEEDDWGTSSINLGLPDGTSVTLSATPYGVNTSTEYSPAAESPLGVSPLTRY